MSILALRRGTLASAADDAFSPGQLTNLYAWYKADGTLWQDSARTIPAVDAGLVGSWDDASINGYNSIQAADVAKPTLQTTGGPSSKPCVTNINGFLNAASLPGWTGGITVFIVGKGNGVTPTNHWWLSLKSDDTQSVIAGFEASGMLEWFSTPRTNIGTSDQTNWAVYEFVDLATGAANSASGLKNGTVTEQTTGSSKTFSNFLRLFHSPGAAFGSPANFAEVIVYKEGKDTTDRSSVRSYLGTKYGITVI